MTPEEAVDFVGRITYKPNTVVKAEIQRPLDDDSPPLFAIFVISAVPDVNDPSATTQIVSSERFMLDQVERLRFGPDALLRIIWSLLQQHEMHEAAEWFRLDGVTVHDPHPELPSPQDVFRGYSPSKTNGGDQWRKSALQSSPSR